jgi:hypothetical protein
MENQKIIEITDEVKIPLYNCDCIIFSGSIIPHLCKVHEINVNTYRLRKSQGLNKS